jgi:hypothetical protein
MNPFEAKFQKFTESLTKKNADGNAEHIASKSGEVFKDKPFTDEYHGIYQIAQWGQYLAQIVTFTTTAALGVFALTHIVPLSWGIYIAVPLGLLFAFGVEKVKRSTLAIASKHLLKYKTFGFVGFVALATLCVSIAAALYGAKELPGVVYAVPVRTIDPAAVATLTADIDRVQRDIDRVQSNLKAGKNWVAENRTLPKLQSQRAALAERRDAATTDAQGRGDAAHLEALADRAAKVDKMQWYSVGAAIVAELIFLLCTAFILYFLFRHYAEMMEIVEAGEKRRANEAADSSAADPVATTKPAGATVAQPITTNGHGVGTSNGVPITNDVRRPIGFAYGPARDDSMSNDAMSNTVVIDSSMKPCAWCSTLYKPRTTWQKFCTPGCKLSENEHRVGTRFDPSKAKFKKKTST